MNSIFALAEDAKRRNEHRHSIQYMTHQNEKSEVSDVFSENETVLLLVVIIILLYANASPVLILAILYVMM